MFSFGALEMLLIVVVAVLVFGPRLPQVAAEAAHFIGRMKRSLAELRRETGIDQEIAEARRKLESAVPSEVRTLDVAGTLRRKVREVEGEVKGMMKRAGADPGGTAAQTDGTPDESTGAGSPTDPQDPPRP